MKKLLFVLLTLAALSASAFVNNPGMSSYENNKGEVVVHDTQWIMVKNTSAATSIKGAAYVWDTAEDDGVSVTVSATQTRTPVCVAAEAVADDAFMKCIVRGKIDYAAFLAQQGDATAGEAVYMSEDTAGYLQYEAADTAGAAGYKSVGVFLDSSAATGSVEIFVDTL